MMNDVEEKFTQNQNFNINVNAAVNVKVDTDYIQKHQQVSKSCLSDTLKGED